jgi:N-formylglutamate amidohydrolase
VRGDALDPPPAWSISRAGGGPLVAIAVHQGHALRPEVAANIRLGHAEREREEDPYTGVFTRVGATRVVVHRSRFEVDLNRPPVGALYLIPVVAWGLDLWRAPPDVEAVCRSRALHRDFYAALEARLSEIARRHERFVVYDLHSYNHRRGGPDAPPAPPEGNPDVNLGTGSMNRPRWGHVADAFVAAMRAADPTLDVRENVRFRGGWLPRWVHERFPDEGCALAIEFKKTFMDEWSGLPDPTRIEALADALERTVEPVTAALSRGVSSAP